MVALLESFIAKAPPPVGKTGLFIVGNPRQTADPAESLRKLRFMMAKRAPDLSIRNFLDALEHPNLPGQKILEVFISAAAFARFFESPLLPYIESKIESLRPEIPTAEKNFSADELRIINALEACGI